MIEPLELRIAPAAVVTVVGRTATWTDFDGDKVTLKWTTGNAPAFVSDPVGVPDGVVVKRINFDASHNGAGVSLTVKAAGGGDGRIDLGQIDAAGFALSSWSSPRATIAEIDAGDGRSSFKTFVSGGIGVHAVGLFTGSGGDGTSTIAGSVGTFTVNGDIGATRLQINAPAGAKLSKVDVKGSLLGTAAGIVGPSGVLEVNADEVGAINIGGAIIGGKTGGSGVLQNFTKVGAITIKGGIIGGDSVGSGLVTLADVKKLSVGGNLQGGTVGVAGRISGNSVESLTLGGSIIGGPVGDTATIAFASAKTILIKGSVIGTPKIDGTTNALSAVVFISGEAGSVTVGGDLIGGSNDAGVNISYNGALIFGGNVKAITIKGSILGTDGLPAAILARGTTPGADGNFNAIGKLTIGGNVTLAYIAAGHGLDSGAVGLRVGTAENSDAGIGSVSVGGSWLHSSLTAGISDTGSTGVDGSDTLAAALGDVARQARIGPIVIKGDVLDNGAFAGTSGFAAEKIAKLTVGGQTVFTTGTADRKLSWDQIVFVREVPAT